MAYALNHATILNGHLDMEPKQDMCVIVDDDGIIESIAKSSTVLLPREFKQYDLKGAYLLPGLINLHAHLCGTGKPTSSSGASNLVGLVTNNPIGRSWLRHRIQKSAETELLSGVTTLRCSGDPCYADIQTRDAINKGEYRGPRILACGWGITPKSGHGRGIIAQQATTAQEAQDLVAQIASHNPDCIKLLVTGGVFDAEKPGEPGILRMTPEMIEAACKKAHSYNLPVAAHVESTAGIAAALKAGVDTIEHGAVLTDEIIELFEHNGAGRTSSLTTTISPAIPLARFSAEKTHSTDVVKLNADIVFKGIVTAAKQALSHGIQTGLGTDATCPYVTHYDMWRELVYFHELVEVSTSFALHTATQVNAQILGLEDITGTIDEGKSADMIVSSQNPLDDLEALRKLDMVIARGKVIINPRPHHMGKIDRDMDKILHTEA